MKRDLPELENAANYEGTYLSTSPCAYSRPEPQNTVPIIGMPDSLIRNNPRRKYALGTLSEVHFFI